MKKWDEMSAQERDALVATEVMEWDLRDEFFSDGDYAGALLYNEGECMGSPGEGYRPSTDIAAAWPVVEKMRSEGVYIDVEPRCDRYDAVAGWAGAEDEDVWAQAFVTGSDAPEVICKAALRAKGIGV